MAEVLAILVGFGLIALIVVGLRKLLGIGKQEECQDEPSGSRCYVPSMMLRE